MLTFGGNLLALKNGSLTHIAGVNGFESPIAYEGKIFYGPRASEISQTYEVSALYAGNSEYDPGFNYPATTHGKLYFIGDDNRSTKHVYCFSYE
jgi:hypothetical protein